MAKDKKVFVIGLDCATPQLVFDRWIDDLPNLRSLIDKGLHGELKTTVPPITVPAWTSMMSSKSPGKLGFYGFRNRKNYTYDEMYYANSSYVHEDRVWNILSKQNKKVCVVGVPQTYPPAEVNGCLVAGFLTPDIDSDYTYPEDLKWEIRDEIGEYILDVKNFRTEDKEYLVRQIYQMTDKRFELVEYLMDEKEWDFFMFVEMGIDRIHHGLWKYFDEDHRMYEPDTKYENAIRDYYIYTDQKLGRILEKLDDDTYVFVVSDHGAKKMEGGICLNEWLIKEGYLALKSAPTGVAPLKNENIDWSKTGAWGSGGYYGRLFMNVEGREPEGIIPAAEYDAVRDELVQKLEALGDEKGNPMGTRALKPENVYPVVNNVAPDLILYFGDLFWRSVGSVGLNSIYTFENDTGPDDANHAEHGIFILAGTDRAPGKVENLHVMDVAPTILKLLGEEVPGDMEGKPIL